VSAGKLLNGDFGGRQAGTARRERIDQRDRAHRLRAVGREHPVEHNQCRNDDRDDRHLADFDADVEGIFLVAIMLWARRFMTVIKVVTAFTSRTRSRFRPPLTSLEGC
jgi:hypothetical protein